MNTPPTLDGPTPPAVYALGSNGSGQLGIGHTEDVSTPQPCRWIGSQPRRPRSVAAGGNHTVILAEDGTAWLAGGSDALRRNVCEDPDVAPAFRKVQFMHPFKFELLNRFAMVAATWESITFVGHSGEIFTVGTGHKGELGLGGQCVETTRPRLNLSFPPDMCKVIDIAASMSHTVVVLDNGEVWGWGSGRKSQIGEPAELVWTPRRISGIPFKAKRAACGREFTYVVGSSPEEHIVLGSDKYRIKSSAILPVDAWQTIGSSWSSIFVLSENGKLSSWGRDDRGQLGPASLPLLKQIVIGSEHVVALDSNGNVLSWGWNEHGNCGGQSDDSGNVAGRWNELRMTEPVVPLGAGCATSFLIAKPHSLEEQ